MVLSGGDCYWIVLKQNRSCEWLCLLMQRGGRRQRRQQKEGGCFYLDSSCVLSTGVVFSSVELGLASPRQFYRSWCLGPTFVGWVPVCLGYHANSLLLIVMPKQLFWAMEFARIQTDLETGCLYSLLFTLLYFLLLSYWRHRASRLLRSKKCCVKNNLIWLNIGQNTSWVILT